MPRAKPTQNIEELLLAGDELEPGAGSIESQVLAEFNQADDQDAWQVSVSRFVKANAPEEFCFNCAPTDFPIVQKIQDEWGAGMYIVRARRNGKIVRAFRYAVAEPKARPVDAVKTEMQGLSATLAAAMDRQSQMIERLFERSQAPQSGKAESLTDLVTALGTLHKISAPPAPAPAPAAGIGIADLLGIFKLGIETASDHVVRPTDSGGLLGFAERLFQNPFIQKLVETAGANPPPTAPPPTVRPIIPTPPGATAARVQPPAPRQPGEVAPPLENGSAAAPQPQADQAAEQQALIENFMRQQVLYLVGRAHQWEISRQTRSHPDLYAEWVIDNIPVEMLQPILELPDPVAALLLYVPEAARHRDWFGQLIESVRLELTDEGGPEDNGPRLNGGGTPEHVSGPTGASPGPNP